MLLNIHHNEIIAVFLVRVFLGLLFFFQGYDAVFKVKISGVIETFEYPLKNTAIPRFLIVLAAYFTSYTELIGGLFLIFGFIKYYSLYLLGINMLIANLAFGLINPMWDTKHVFVRLSLLTFLLCVPSEWDALSVDYLWSAFRFIKNFF